MAGNHAGLPFLPAHLAAHAVGIAHGNVEELPALGGLIVGTGGIHHVSQVIEFVREHLFAQPSLVAGPAVGMPRIHGAGRIEIAVGFLRLAHNVEHRVHIVYEPCALGLVLHGHQHIAGSFDGLIHVGIVEREPRGRIVRRWMLALHEVFVAAFALAFRESQRYGHLAGGLQALSPEGAVGHADGGERYGSERIARLGRCCRKRGGVERE